MGYVLIGKHELTSVQKELVSKAGLGEEICKFDNIKNVMDVVMFCRKNNCNVLVEGLPVGLMAELVTVARRYKVKVYTFDTRTVFVVNNGSKCPSYCDVVLERGDKVVCKMTVSLREVTKVVFSYYDVVKRSMIIQ